jgi:hypothetical protein
MADDLARAALTTSRERPREVAIPRGLPFPTPLWVLTTVRNPRGVEVQANPRRPSVGREPDRAKSPFVADAVQTSTRCVRLFSRGPAAHPRFHLATRIFFSAAVLRSRTLHLRLRTRERTNLTCLHAPPPRRCPRGSDPRSCMPSLWRCAVSRSGPAA